MAMNTEVKRDILGNVETAIEVVKIACTFIKESGPDGKPSGHLFIEMMNIVETFETYEKMISLMIHCKVIRRENHKLYLMI